VEFHPAQEPEDGKHEQHGAQRPLNANPNASEKQEDNDDSKK